jgi:hypothetical protein
MAGLATAALLLSGCCSQLQPWSGRGTGGGWVPSSSSSANRATFGFVWQSTESGPILAKGSWSDGSVKFRIVDGLLDQVDQDDCVYGNGHYIPTGKAGTQGDIKITLCDAGEPGTGGDTIDLQLSGGTYDGYHKSGPLSGGNIQLKSD